MELLAGQEAIHYPCFIGISLDPLTYCLIRLKPPALEESVNTPLFMAGSRSLASSPT
jgi:hypothetical protein